MARLMAAARRFAFPLNTLGRVSAANRMLRSFLLGCDLRRGVMFK